MNSKQCRVCGHTKPLVDFHKRAKAKDGRQSSCKECSNDASSQSRKTRYQADELAKRQAQIRTLCRKYNITQEVYYETLERQEGKCYICSRRTILVMDHDHNTGKFRKMLCSSCNVGLGFFADSPELLDIAAQYLRDHQSSSAE